MNTDSKLDNIRHSLAHLLAAAVLKEFPDAQLGIGPTIEHGFYYDFLLPLALTPDDLKGFEKEMRRLINIKLPITGKEIMREEALSMFTDQPFKQELIRDFSEESKTLTAYAIGDVFSDLCKGGHVENTGEIKADAFKLTSIAGAYWKGSEKNPQLQRIYGLAFESKEELAEHLRMLEEAKKRDHRKLGQELKIFTFDDDVGPGLPLWLPNGAIMIEELENLAKKTELEYGYQRVRTPHLAKESMYLKSGHLPYYEDSMYPPMEYEGGKYYLKAMNCPHHHKIYAALRPRLKDLPLRLAEYGTCYRHEKSGELFGLMRVRSMQMNDAHIYCTEEQFADEFKKVNEIYLKYFKIFGIEKYHMRLSTHDPKRLGEKYVDEPELWKKTEDMVCKTLVESNIPFVEVANEAAFYGPKIDVQVWSAIGREFTLATNQVDFAVPKRFGLTYVDQDGVEKTPLCIHRAPLSTHERLIGFLIEHYAGAFPFWLAPAQIAILSINEKNNSYIESIVTVLHDQNIRVTTDTRNESIGKKIREAEMQKIPYVVVVGDKEAESKTVALRARGQKDLGVMTLEKAIEHMQEH
jgi:threonyl-tRNA synthetase